MLASSLDLSTLRLLSAIAWINFAFQPVAPKQFDPSLSFARRHHTHLRRGWLTSFTSFRSHPTRNARFFTESPIPINPINFILSVVVSNDT
ncbi:uncharacterized protein BDZ83DRAFT_247568 [Colletotrichum acutatum]|uniref:Secreted protein n=1 Tax=Glomerella acutata TaxID=27357 RepID=A0AAD8XPY0_GLOAC|nr:uncharacterized protein BDZ83DRAFT_247568 [Colletotrichum acutatum]KAK1731374.1 hypothetical protein BDZ83DRAFT_247568 [Colletotrichum acutatum]